jgi:hypothetical protein
MSYFLPASTTTSLGIVSVTLILGVLISQKFEIEVSNGRHGLQYIARYVSRKIRLSMRAYLLMSSEEAISTRNGMVVR